MDKRTIDNKMPDNKQTSPQDKISQYEQYKKIKRDLENAGVIKRKPDYNITSPFERIRLYDNQ